MQRSRDIVVQTVVMLSCLGVGVLLGGQFCAPASSEVGLTPDAKTGESPVRVVQRVVQSPPKIIYKCPPEPQSDTKPASPESPAQPKPPAKTLPQAEAEFDPAQRQKLLSWARNQARELKSCRDDRAKVYRLAVTLYLDETGQSVRRVEFNIPESEVSERIQQCIRRRILRWKPPSELVGERKRLMFGLHL